MGDASRLVEGLYQAALVSQSAQSTPDQIAQAVQFVEQAKAQDVHSVLQAASQLAQPQQPLEVQVAGLSLLHQQVQARWRQMNAEAQSALGTIANNIFAAAASGNSPWVVKGKASQLLASVSAHQGAEAFNTLTNQLLAVGANGPAVQVEMACLVLRYVSEDVTHFDDVDGVAKKPMLAAVMASSSAVLSFAVQVLQQHTTMAFQLRSQGDEQGAQRAMSAVAAAFGVVASYMDWAPLKAVASSQLVDILTRFMDVDDFRMSALDVLKQVTSRKQITDSEDVYVPLMASLATTLVAIADAILKPEYLKSLDFGGPLEDFGIRLCTTMTTFSELHFRCVSKPEEKLMFIRQMLKFVEHPYLRLAAQALPFWQQYLNKLNPPQHGNTASLQSAAPPSSDAASKKGTSRGMAPPKPAYLLPYDPPDDVWNELAYAMTGHMMHVVLVPDIEVEPLEYFETEQEYRDFCASFRGQIKVIMRGTTTRVPHQALQCTTQFLHFCLEQSGPERPKEKLLAHLEAAVFCLEAVMGVVLEHSDRAQLLPGVGQVMQTLMQYSNPMPAAILLQMRGLEALAKPLEHLPHMAMPLVERGLNLLQSIPWAQNGQLPPPVIMSPQLKEAQSARLMCSKLLLALARDAPTALAPHLQTIAQKTETLWQEGKLQEGERVQLCEGLLCASGALGSESEQLVLEWMLRPLHAIWTSKEWQAHFVSPQEFVKSFLPWQVEVGGTTSVGARELRWSVYHQLALLERCMRRSTEGPPLEDGQTVPPPHPWNSHLEWVMIPVLQIIVCLHGLWTPDIRAALQPIAGVLGMDAREKAVRLKADMVEARKDLEIASVSGANEAGARTWLQGVRDMCYMIVFGASVHCPAFWLCQPVAAFVPNTLLAHLEYIEHRHLRTLLRHVLAVWVIRCPQQLRTQWLAPLLNPVINHMHQRLSEAWKQLASATVSPSGSEEQLSQERLQDSLVRDISKEYMELLFKMVHRSDKSEPHGNLQAQDNGSCFNFVLETNPQLALVTVATATDSLSWPDSEVAKKALMFLRLVIPKLGQRVPGIDVAAGVMLRSTILALANPLFSTSQAEMLSLARLLCLTYMRTSPHIRQQLQALPGITPQAVSEFETAFFAAYTEKAQRDLVKMLLLNVGDESLRNLLMLHGQPSSTKVSSSQVPKADAENRTSNGGDVMLSG